MPQYKKCGLLTEIIYPLAEVMPTVDSITVINRKETKKEVY